jgi:CBS domain-containing protein
MTRVGELMNKQAKICLISDTLQTAAMKMWDHDIGCVAVVDGEGRPVGVLTDRDICMAAYFQGRLLAELRVENVISKELFACGASDSLQAAATLMMNHQVRRLPVIDNGKIVGILTMNDLARAAATKPGQKHNGVSAAEVEATLAAICQPRTQPIPSAA